MMKTRWVSKEEYDSISLSLLDRAVSPPPELPLAPTGHERSAYLRALRSAGDREGVHMLLVDGRWVGGAGAVAESPVDEEILRVPVAKLLGCDVAEDVDPSPLVDALLEEAQSSLEAELVLARVSPASPLLAPLLARGGQVYGATVLYSGEPHQEHVEGITVGGEDDLDAASDLVRRVFVDTHLSRDPRVDGEAAPELYARWLRGERRQGAQILLARDGERLLGVAAARRNDLAARYLNEELVNLHLLAVAPEARGDGIGPRLARAAMSGAARSGAERFQTGVDLASVGAQRVYTRAGLLPAGGSLAVHLWL